MEHPLHSVTDALTNTTHTAYDPEGRVIATCGNRGHSLNVAVQIDIVDFPKLAS